jgi:hypothetical protein
MVIERSGRKIDCRFGKIEKALPVRPYLSNCLATV